MLQKIELAKGDLTKERVDAIVNAANQTLLGGGGVDGAIHKAAGPELLQACEKLNGCSTGDAKITDAYRLPAKHVIHTVGPIWRGGNRHEAERLTSCYRRSIELAAQHRLRTISFPAISCGAYGYPPEQAAEVALRTIAEALQTAPTIERVRFLFFDDNVLAAFRNVHAKLGESA